MRKISFVIALFFCCLSACVNDTAPKQNIVSKTEDSGTISSYLDSSIKIYNKENSKYISVDTAKFEIPVKIDISYSNIYDGIYELKRDSLVRHKFLIINSLVYLTTYEDLGTGIRADLYVYDLAHKSLVSDSEFKSNSLHSSAGIFIFERSSNKIFSVDKSGYYQKKHAFIIPAGVYEVKGRYFKNIKIVYKVGEEIPGDTTSLIPFYKSSISLEGGKALILPEDWWKADPKTL